MSTAGAIASDLTERNGRPAYVQFYTVAKQLPVESAQQGRYVARDIDMVTVRQIGATDSVVFKVDQWLAQNKLDVQAGRLEETHAAKYEESYRRWKAGQEMPVEGTPVKTWPVISPAQVETLIRAGIRTVEDLAGLNDEGLRKVGMGAVEMKKKAKAWMAASQDKGKLTQDMAALQRTNDQLQNMVTTLTAKVEAMQQEIKAAKKPKGRKRAEETDDAISASDLTDD